MQIPFIGAAYKSRSLPISSQTCRNWYLEANGQGSKSQASLVNTPGLLEFADLGTNKPVVGMHTMGDKVYCISNTTLFSVDVTGTVVEIGDVGYGRLAMADNGYQIIMCSSVGGWIYSVDGGLVEITDTDFPNATSVTFFDGYFVLTTPDSTQFYISSLNDGTTYDALDYASAEGGPDNLVACINDHRELWLFGDETIEIWYNSGDSGFPFDRLSGAFVEKGCGARFSPAKIDNTVFWLGNDNVVYRAVNYLPVRISTHAIEAELSGYSATNDAFGYTYSQEGHSFYVLTFPTDEKTWVYDAATGLWHERNGYGIGRHRGNCYSHLNGRHLVGDYQNGKIYELDLDTYTDDGDEIVRERSTQVITNNGLNLFMSSLEVSFESGVGLSGGEDPPVMLQWSDDGGRTWSNEHWVGIGKIGEFRDRARWRRLGRFRDRVFRLRISAAVKPIVIKATADITGGTS